MAWLPVNKCISHCMLLYNVVYIYIKILFTVTDDPMCSKFKEGGGTFPALEGDYFVPLGSSPRSAHWFVQHFAENRNAPFQLDVSKLYFPYSFQSGIWVINGNSILYQNFVQTLWNNIMLLTNNYWYLLLVHRKCCHFI